MSADVFNLLLLHADSAKQTTPDFPRKQFPQWRRHHGNMSGIANNVRIRLYHNAGLQRTLSFERLILMKVEVPWRKLKKISFSYQGT